MKVSLKHGFMRYKGLRLQAGDEFECNEYWFEQHGSRLDLIEDQLVASVQKKEEAPAKEKVTNEKAQKGTQAKPKQAKRSKSKKAKK